MLCYLLYKTKILIHCKLNNTWFLYKVPQKTNFNKIIFLMLFAYTFLPFKERQI